MGLLDLIADRSFRDDPAGRVVVFGGGLRGRGYLVKSKAEELKIRSFLKMYGFAELSIQLLGTIAACAWLGTFSSTSGRPAEEVFRALWIYLGFYSLVAGIPQWLLWKSYKTERFRFVSPEDEVVVTSKPPRNPQFLTLAGIAFVGFLILLGAVFMLVNRR
jgi:hypothetical protein